MLRFRPPLAVSSLPRRLFPLHSSTSRTSKSSSSSSSAVVAMASSEGNAAKKPETPDPATLFDGGTGAEELRALCVGACSRDTPLLPRSEIQAKLSSSLPAWRLSEDGASLFREFRAKNFASAVAFLSAAAGVADAIGHHPDFHLTDWNAVRVDATTHAAGGVTLADLHLAARLDAVPCAYSPKWLREQKAAREKKEEKEKE